MEKLQKKKSSLLKRVLKWFFGILILLLILLISIPYLFKDKIKGMVENTINKNVNASVSLNDINLSLLRNFPKASLALEKTTVINKAPFLGDTLFYANEINVNMSVLELFKSADEAINLESFSINKGKVNIILNEKGEGNYNIAKPSLDTVSNTEPNSFKLNINAYNTTDLDFIYLDKASKMKVEISNISHSGIGNFNQDILDLNTKTKANFSLEMEGVNYMNKLPISLDAIIGIDLNQSKYSFKENTGFINQLPLEFDGFFQLVEEGQLYQLNFKTPTSSFKNALALFPKQYAGNIDGITTKGNFTIDGNIDGTYTEDKIPKLNIRFNSEKAMFKYKTLPKAVQDIDIDVKIINKTGILNDTYINVDKFDFRIDKNKFYVHGDVNNLIKNPRISLNAKGKIDLANIAKVYPIDEKMSLSGILDAKIKTSLDMNSVEKKRYQNIKNSGSLRLSNFKYEGESVAKPFLINKTEIVFNSKTIKLNQFIAKTGDSDLSINGNLENFYGFIFKDQVLQGKFNLKSNLLKVDDFLTEETTTEETTTNTSLKIPSFLDCSFNATAKTVVYDNLNLKNVTGTLTVKNEAINLQNLKMNVFNGQVAMNGNVSTKEKVSNFKMEIDLNKIGIGESFTQLNTLNAIAPIAKTIEGKLNSKLSLSGNLAEDMTPDLKSISGDLVGQLLETKVNKENSKVLSLASNNLKFLNVDKLNLNEATANFVFDNGRVILKPLTVNYEDIKIKIDGNHGFDQTMDYNVNFDIPVKYLGNEVTSLLAKLSPKEANSIKNVPVSANLKGSFKNPSINTNLSQAKTKIVTQLVEKQKQDLINKGKDKLNSLLNNTLNKKDSSKTKEDTKDKIKGVLTNLFGKKTKKKKDTNN